MDLPQQKNRVIITISIITIVIGILVMAGRIFNIALLENTASGLIVVKFNAALCFVLFGIVLLIPQYLNKYNVFLLIFAFIATLIGVITLAQDIFHFNSGIDQLFVNDSKKISPEYPNPGRMAFNAAICVTLLGIGFLMRTAKKYKLYVFAQYTFHIVTLISGIALIGYLYGVSLFKTLFYVTSMAGVTALLFFLLSIGASLLNPSSGITKLFTGKMVGNQMAKRLSTLIICTIIIFGTLKQQSQHLQIFSSLSIALSVLAICFLLLSLLVIWDTANWLNNIDMQRSKAEAGIKMMNAELERKVEQRSLEFRKSEEKYHSLIEQASDAIYVVDFNGKFEDVNDSMCNMTGYRRDELLKLHIYNVLDPEDLKNDPLPLMSKDFKQTIRERKFVKRDGSEFFTEINAKLFNDNCVMVIARDITGRKKMEIELREAELKFRTIADKSMVGVYIVQNGVFTYVNPRFAEIFDYKPEELMNIVPLEIIIHEDYRAITTEHVRRRMAGEIESVHYEAMGRKKDGTANWVEFYGSRTTIGGEPTIIGSMIDITERKKAEEELKSSEQKYKLLFDSNPMPMWMIAKDDFSVIAVNDAAIKHYGYSRDELLKKGVKSLRHPDDTEQQLDGYQREVNGSLGIVRHLKKDGTIMYIQLIVHDIIFEGRPVRLSLTNDVTEKLQAEESLKKSEANLQTILNTTDTAYALFDKKLKVLAYNQKATEFIKSKYGQYIKKESIFTDFFPPDRFPEFNSYIDEVMAGNNVNYEIDYCQPDKSVQWYYVRMFPITSGNKEIFGLLIALYDITERKNAEQDLKSAYGRIQSHMNSIKDMAWKQSHLIRSPLANLKGLTSILKTDRSDIVILEHIQTELDRLDSIIIEMAEEASGHETTELNN